MSTMKGTRDSLLGKTTRRYRSVTVDGTEYRLQSLTEREKSQFEKQVHDGKGRVSIHARARLLVLTLVDENGDRLLTSDDFDLLDNVDGSVTQQLFNAALEHCGFGDEDIEELTKN